MPLVYSVDGMTCDKTMAYKKHMTSLLVIKWDCRYSEMVGFVRGWMSLAIICSTTMLLQVQGVCAGGARKPEIKDSVGVEALGKAAD